MSIVNSLEKRGLIFRIGRFDDETGDPVNPLNPSIELGVTFLVPTHFEDRWVEKHEVAIINLIGDLGRKIDARLQEAIADLNSNVGEPK